MPRERFNFRFKKCKYAIHRAVVPNFLIKEWITNSTKYYVPLITDKQYIKEDTGRLIKYLIQIKLSTE